MGFAVGYRCDGCAGEFELDRPLNTCPVCGGLLEVSYDLARMRSELRRPAAGGDRSIWRWRELLPLPLTAEVVSLGEGGTPLVPSVTAGPALGLRRLFFKNDTLMPTGSFKDRGFSLAVSFARQLALREGLTYSSGNAGASFAAYASRAGIRPLVLVEHVASTSKRAMVQLLGGAVAVLDFDSMEEINAMLADVAGDRGMYQFVNFINPLRHEAMKTYAYEIAEALGWRAPTIEVHPVGTGGGLWGAWKGYRELLELGWIDRELPQMVAVQPAVSAHFREAFLRGASKAERYGNASASLAQSIAADAPIQKGERVLRAVYESGGWADGVTDLEILDAMRLLGREGIAAEPAAAAPLAAVIRGLANGSIGAEDTVVCVVTGSALKQPSAMLEAVGEPAYRLRANADALRELLARWRATDAR